MDPRAGTPAQPSDLVDLDALTRRVLRPRARPRRPRRSGWCSAPAATAGRPLDTRVQRGAHRRHHRRDRRVPPRPGHRRPAVHRPRHARAVRARLALRARGARRGRRRGARRRARLVDADARRLARDPAAQRRRHVGGRAHAGPGPRRRHRRDPVAQPARATAASSTTRRTAAPRGPTRPAGSPTAPTRSSRPGWRSVPRVRARARARRRHHPQARLPVRRTSRPGQRHRRRRDPRGGRAHRRGPAGRRVRRVLGRDRRALRARPDRGEPDGRPALGVHDARLGRQDPDGLLVAVRDGVAGQPHGRRPGAVRHRDGQRRRLRPARHRHARRA